MIIRTKAYIVEAYIVFFLFRLSVFSSIHAGVRPSSVNILLQSFVSSFFLFAYIFDNLYFRLLICGHCY